MSWYDGLEHIVREQVPLAPWTWLRLGGAAEFFAEPSSVEELATLMRLAHGAKVSVRWLGGGSNVLVQDSGVSGLVVHLSASAFGEISVDGSEITAGGGAKLSHLVSIAAREGLSGLESLVGIPGTVGGAVRRNAIGHGAAIGQWTKSVTAMTTEGEIVELPTSELLFTYRDSNLHDLLVLVATLNLDPGDSQNVTRQMQKLWIMKRGGTADGRAGSWPSFVIREVLLRKKFIEQCGAKSATVGGASLNETKSKLCRSRRRHQK